MTPQSQGAKSYTKVNLNWLSGVNGTAKFWLSGVNDTSEIWLSGAIDTAELWLSGVIGDLKLEYIGEFAAVFENIFKAWTSGLGGDIWWKKRGVYKSRETVPLKDWFYSRM